MSGHVSLNMPETTMKSFKQIMQAPATSYTGSEITRDMIQEQIRERYGDKEAEKYDPLVNCRTFKQWLTLGYRVRKGEKSLRSVTYVEEKDEKGNVVKKWPRTVHLFYYLQVEKLSDK
jgi:hypothetical protein